jgi:hypothetical protein
MAWLLGLVVLHWKKEARAQVTTNTANSRLTFSRRSPHRSNGGAEVRLSETSLQFTASHLQVLTSATGNAFISWHLVLTISNFVRKDFARQAPPGVPDAGT